MCWNWNNNLVPKEEREKTGPHWELNPGPPAIWLPKAGIILLDHKALHILRWFKHIYIALLPRSNDLVFPTTAPLQTVA